MRLDINDMKREMYRSLVEMGITKFGPGEWQGAMKKYQNRPREFAYKILGSRWWSAQEEVASGLVKYDRVAVRSGHGVGKTYLAADLVLWFLYTHPGAVVLTTAPTWKQVKHYLWREIRRRYLSAKVRLPGRLLRTKLELSDESYAMGIATESSGKGVNFQGCHADNLLIVIDEASGVSPDIWEAAEGAAVGRNNRILAIGNPLMTTGRFYDIFKGSNNWHKVTINGMRHPNVIGKGRTIPGCITQGWIDSRIPEWCEEITGEEPDSKHDVITWKGKIYRPSDSFRIRVLGEFPRSEDTALIPLAWIEAAQARHMPRESVPTRLACDVARYGDDLTVIGLRQGSVMLNIWPVKGENTMQVANRIVDLAYAHHPSAITIDSAGLGAGVVDRLVELGIDNIDPFNSSSAPYRKEVFANRRAELYWGLREQFRAGTIDILPDSALAADLAAVRYLINARGLIQIETKEEIKRRLGRSPDRADMLAMLYDNAFDAVAFTAPTYREPSERDLFRAEMRIW